MLTTLSQNILHRSQAKLTMKWHIFQFFLTKKHTVVVNIQHANINPIENKCVI